MHRKHVHISYFCSREPAASALCHLPEIRPKSKRCTTSTSKGPRCPFLDRKQPERQLRGYLQFSTDQSGRESLLIRCWWNAVVQLSWREQGLSSPVLFALLHSSPGRTCQADWNTQLRPRTGWNIHVVLHPKHFVKTMVQGCHHL